MTFQSKYFQALILSLFVLALYVLTMMPGLGFTDSGELAAVATTLGIAHPTGYPLYTILGHIWTLLIPFNPVYSLNLFAGFCTALSVGLLYVLLFEIMQIIGESNKRAIYFSGSGALIFATATTVWSQATGLEVYSLQLVLFMLVIRTFLQAMWFENNNRLIYLWAFFVGLSFTNHGTTILLAPSMIFGYFYDWKSRKPSFHHERFLTLLKLSIPFLIGLAVWLYLPIRSAQMPEFNWGEVHRSWDKFSYHAFGKQYQVWMFNDGTSTINFPRFIESVISLTSWIGIIPIFFGFYSIWKGHRGLLYFLLLLIVGNLFYSLNYGIHDIETYFLTALIALTIPLMFGLRQIIGLNNKLLPVLLVIPLVNLGLNFRDNDKHADDTVDEYLHLMIDPLPKNSVIISSQWDYYCSAFWYKQSVEHYRDDIILVEQELLRRTWYPHHLQQRYPFLKSVQSSFLSYEQELDKFESGIPFSADILQSRYEQVLNAIIDTAIQSRRPVFMTAEVLQNEPRIAQRYSKIPQGLAFRVMLPPPSGLPELPLPLLNADLTNFAKNVTHRKGHLYEGVGNMASNELLNMAQYAWMTGRTKEAKIFLKKAEMIQPNNPLLLQLRNVIGV